MSETEIKLNTIDEALEDIRAGRLLIVVDDKDRENEGDFICAGEKITPEIVNFMIKNGRGMLCAPLTEQRCEMLELPMMVDKNTSLHETPFTVSVDLIGHGCTTGISAYDRARTIRALVADDTRPGDLGRPGHIMPLKAKEKGVLRRPGHTEAVVDLTRMAGLTPGGALVEILNEDGTMARLPQLMEISAKYHIKIISIEDLIKYRLATDSIVTMGERVKLPTEYGNFEAIPFIQHTNELEHIAIVKGSWTLDDEVLVRVHSSCVTGDIFGSCKCDCGAQLHEALRMIEARGQGVVLYLNQEGRGIGLFNKIRAYKLQEQGRDTVQANIDLGFKADERDYGVGASILRELGLRKIRLMTNNPVKRAGLEGYGIQVVENVPIEIAPNKYNAFYLKTKRDKLGHTLELVYPDKK
ncbi:MAG: bifunctional 3,4-dihydroxy-2-butanone-4-phosphate synthase/GTP cyclohydrolase II [Bacteroidales bacterium]|nr:bifunctional 3,4-dihydroxy-2-butanone-4-phosphate synthase/GTP cyclohydrolase II [Bacteroidales bacterium]